VSNWLTWTVGVTTVTTRRHTTLPKTLESLKKGGFSEIRLFVDIPPNTKADYADINLDITFRYPALGIHGNWILSLYELYLREPNVDRYAIFQDDIVTYKNLRQYLNRCKLRDNECWNLYTFPPGYQTSPPPVVNEPGTGWCSQQGAGWYPSNQFGRSALGLVFPREGVVRILTHPHIVRKAQDTRRRNTIDGAISEVIRDLKITELVHDPSLLNHIGEVSSVEHPKYPACRTFLGEEFSALDLL